MPTRKSAFWPQMNVEYRSAAPSELSSEMNPSDTPLRTLCMAPTVTVKSAALVPPVIHTLPLASGATPLAPDELPPMSVDHISWEAVGFSLVTNAPPGDVVSNAPGVVGKSTDDVPPDT